MCAGSSQEDALDLSNLRDTAEVKWSYFYQFIIVIIVIRLIIVIFFSSCSWTMLRSKELRESLSRPSSRLSCENGMEKMGKDLVRKDHQYRDHWWQWWSHKSQHIHTQHFNVWGKYHVSVGSNVPQNNCHYWSMVMFPTLNLLTNQDGFRDWGFWNLS